MIDLSYLTEEEQEMILAVLKRDTELKKLEEQRTRQLYKTEKDRSRLKYLTGEWFYETKYHRHREKIHGSDIIRASMRQRKPVTILELSQRWDERPSFLNSQKKDVFIPPELSGIIEEPSTQSQNERVEHQMPEGQQERQRPQIKPRLNPFNIVCSQRETSRISNSVNEANQTPAEEPLPSNESYTPLHSILNTDNTDTHIATQCADKPVPKKRLLLFSCQNSLLDFASSDTTVKQAMTPSPRGILKHSSSSCSYIESLRLHIPNNNDSNSSQSSAPVSPISPPLSPCSEHSASSWLDRKQVRFSSIIRAKEREQGENSVLDEDCSALSDQDRELDRSDIVKNDRHELYAEPQSSQVSNFHCSAAVKGKVNPLCTESQTHTVTEEEGRSISKVLEWFVRGSQDAKQRKLKELPAQSKKNKEEPEDHGTSDDKSEELASPVIQQKTKPSPKPRQVFFALFTRAEKKDKSPEVLVSDKEVIIEDKTGISTSECKTLCTMRPQADDSIALQDSVPALSKTTEIIQVTSKTEDDNKTARHVCADILKREMLDQGEISPGRLADLKSFWERGNRGPRILSIKTGAGIEENETYLLNENDHDTLDRRLPDSNISPSKFKPILKTTEYPIDGESTTHEFSLVSRYGVDMSAISLNKDVKPSNLDSSKESEGLSSGLHTLMVKSDVRLMSSSLQLRDNSLQNKGQEEPLPESLLRNISDLKKEISTLKMSPSQQDNKVSINDLKSFWEKEKSGLRVIVGSPTCTPDVEDPFTTLSPKRSSIGSTSPVLTSCLDKMSLSLNKEVSLIVQKEKMEKSQGPTKEPIQDHQGIRGDSEEASPVRTALEHANARPLSISKSLEDLASPPSLSAVTTNTKTSFSDPEQVKIMSMSVPAFMQQEMDWRNGERSFHYDTLRACNTPSNFSMCSEVASMSSVTGSILSICSSEFGSVEVKGTIQFTIHYSQKLGEFHIFIVQCKDLAVADPKRKRSDPYVKCYLLPDKAKYGKRKTCVRKKTQNPTYNEILRFKIPMESLKTQKLNLSVWHNDTFGRNSFLGEAEIDLVEWDFNNMQMNEYQLKGRVQVPSSPKHSAGGEEMRAEMRIALRFLPQTSHSHKNKANGEVQIWVKECKNLPISRGVSIDPFVKCAVLPDNSRKSQQKTRVLKRASNPVFNHTMVYDGFRPEDLKEACVELTVWDHDRFNHFIGGVRLGPGTGKSYGADVDWMDSNSAEAALWDRMMQSQNEWVEDILPLRMLVMARMSR
ncbi:synaptotagmin-like protein 2 isoform X1 [Myxocyprinus asiaticus]|uniref:synaptotagmin-like protein 2 isoform X1 n=2 Tax=Myxocyprinus asiaticus TaxID=70543 RepID=UPI0022222407|nr:synaptotagmin-like protein 2 isoform X1 [Myxocyprinus asiaticus]